MEEGPPGGGRGSGKRQQLMKKPPKAADREVKRMSRDKTKETLEKQLQLLSERSSESKNQNYMELAAYTESMCRLAETIIRISPNLGR